MKSVFIFTIVVAMAFGHSAVFPQTASVQQKVGVIVVDLQGDFTTLKKGSLAVEGTDQAYVDQVRQATESLRKKGYPVYATQDWHPSDHVSFYTNHPGKKAFDVIDVQVGQQDIYAPQWSRQSCAQSANARAGIQNQNRAVAAFHLNTRSVAAVARGVFSGRSQRTARAPKRDSHFAPGSQKITTAPRKRPPRPISGRAVAWMRWSI